MKRHENIKWKILGIAGVLCGSVYLLGDDWVSFFQWWITVMILGACCFPVARRICWGFQDKGWMISKVLGIVFTGFFMWVLGNTKCVLFQQSVCWWIVLIFGTICWGMEAFAYKKHYLEKENFLCVRKVSSTIMGEELLFLVVFLFWTYIAGFHPEAYGTEKFMDYGFMKSLMRSEILPPPDLWFAGKSINYYYGGQYFAAFLTKLTGTRVEESYHLMRTMVAAISFVLPFILVRQMLTDGGKTGKRTAIFGGALAGTGVSFAGNMHYVLVGKIIPWIRKIFSVPQEEPAYWFPNSTRYIGYYPAGNDKTIHEFPSYSFVLGDLHAHVVNVLFVLALICIVYAMVQKSREKSEQPAIWRIFLNPYVWLLSFFIGVFHWTNYWDFVIYYVMGGMGVIYSNYLCVNKLPSRKKRLLATALYSGIHSVQVFLLAEIFALPFTLQFHTMIRGIAVAQNHSRPYQWWLIWGLPLIVTVLLIFYVFWEKDRKQPLPEVGDCYAVILGISAIGLIVIPELVYVRDIYEKEFARSNTMFKLTYQAFIMFGIVMGYGFCRLMVENRTKIKKFLISISFLCFLGCCCYGGTAIHSWFGEIWNRGNYKRLDASGFLETRFPEDAEAIRWLDETIQGTPTVLEANGDSYSDYNRVSAMTGLPTVMGWYVHEWLWRGTLEEINVRTREVKEIYTSKQEEKVQKLLKKYKVAYIFVGKMEREKFEDLNEPLLSSQGEKVYENKETGTYIIKTGNK